MRRVRTVGAVVAAALAALAPSCSRTDRAVDGDSPTPEVEAAVRGEEPLDVQRDDLAPIEGEWIRIVDEATDTAFNLPDDKLFEAGTESAGFIAYSFNGWRPDRSARWEDRVEVRIWTPDRATTIEEALEPGNRSRPLLHEGPTTIDGEPGIHHVVATELAGMAQEHTIYGATMPGGGAIAVVEEYPGGEPPSGIAAEVAATIRFDVGFGGGPWLQRAPLDPGLAGDHRTVVSRDDVTGIEWRMTERTYRINYPVGGGDGMQWSAERPEDRVRAEESVVIVPGSLVASVDQALLEASTWNNYEVLRTAEPVTIDGREGRGGVATFEGGFDRPPYVRRIWAVPLDAGGYLVLISGLLAGPDAVPLPLDELAATVTIPEGAGVVEEYQP